MIELSKTSLSTRVKKKKWQRLVVQGVHCDFFLIYFGLAVQPRERERDTAREDSKDLCGRREAARKTVMMSNELPLCLPDEIKQTDGKKEGVSNAE